MVRHRIPLSFLPASQFVGRNASPVAAAIKPLLVSNNTFGARKTTRIGIGCPAMRRMTTAG
jgi:hypothetical protein